MIMYIIAICNIFYYNTELFDDADNKIWKLTHKIRFRVTDVEFFKNKRREYVIKQNCDLMER